MIPAAKTDVAQVLYIARFQRFAKYLSRKTENTGLRKVNPGIEPVL